MPNLPREKNFSFAAALSFDAKVVDFVRKQWTFGKKWTAFCRKPPSIKINNNAFEEPTNTAPSFCFAFN